MPATSCATSRGTASRPRRPGASASKEAGGVAMATARRPVLAAAIRTQAGAEVGPNAIAPASGRPFSAAMTSGMTPGLW